MSTTKSEFLNELKARGYVHQVTDEAALDRLARSETITGYIGFDCTAPSLHVGNLLGIMMLRKLQQAGHRPIVLIGGGTTKVGDPSGKDEARKLLTDAEIAANIGGIESVFGKFVSLGQSDNDAILVNNADWLDELNYIDFLRDYGRHFSVNRMLSYDSVKLRLEREQPLSFIEFNYMVLQAYDFVELYRRFGCRLQMGGSDQWGNIVNGIELGRRTDGVELFGLTTALLTTASGAKMGKTASGAVWLNPDMLSPYDYWQYWRNTEDADVGRFLKLFTELPLAEIDRVGEARRRRAQRSEEDPRHRGDRAAAWPRGRRPRRRHGARHLRARNAVRDAAHLRGSPRRARERLGHPHRQHACRLCRLDQRGAPPDQGRRSQGERQDGHRREAPADALRPHA